jgi:hypothetical protein
MSKDMFAAVISDGGGGFLFLVKVTECAISGSSGAAVLGEVRHVFGILSDDEGGDQRIWVWAEVYVTGKVGFSGIGFVVGC